MNGVILFLFLSQVALLSALPVEQEKPIERLWNQTKIDMDEENFKLVEGDMLIKKVSSISSNQNIIS